MLDKKLLEELQNYIDEHFEIRMYESSYKSAPEPYVLKNFTLDSISPDELHTFIKGKKQPTISELLMKAIDQKGMTDAEVYKKAGLDRRHFSKIRSANYRPRKNTVLALAIALELTKKQTDKLLSSAGYSLSDSDMSDLVVQFFMEKNIYNLDEVNLALEYFSLKPLSGVQ